MAIRLRTIAALPSVEPPRRSSAARVVRLRWPPLVAPPSAIRRPRRGPAGGRPGGGAAPTHGGRVARRPGGHAFRRARAARASRVRASSAAVTPNRTRLIAPSSGAARTNTADLFDLRARKRISSVRYDARGPGEAVFYGVVMSPDGRRAWIGRRPGRRPRLHRRARRCARSRRSPSPASRPGWPTAARLAATGSTSPTTSPAAPATQTRRAARSPCSTRRPTR